MIISLLYLSGHVTSCSHHQMYVSNRNSSSHANFNRTSKQAVVHFFCFAECCGEGFPGPLLPCPLAAVSSHLCCPHVSAPNGFCLLRGENISPSLVQMHVGLPWTWSKRREKEKKKKTVWMAFSTLLIKILTQFWVWRLIKWWEFTGSSHECRGLKPAPGEGAGCWDQEECRGPLPPSQSLADIKSNQKIVPLRKLLAAFHFVTRATPEISPKTIAQVIYTSLWK